MLSIVILLILLAECSPFSFQSRFRSKITIDNRVLRVSKYEDYVAIVASILAPTVADNNLIDKLAYELFKLDMEMEKQLALQKEEMVKQMETPKVGGSFWDQIDKLNQLMEEMFLDLVFALREASTDPSSFLYLEANSAEGKAILATGVTAIDILSFKFSAKLVLKYLEIRGLSQSELLLFAEEMKIMQQNK